MAKSRKRRPGRGEDRMNYAVEGAKEPSYDPGSGMNEKEAKEFYKQWRNPDGLSRDEWLRMDRVYDRMKPGERRPSVDPGTRESYSGGGLVTSRGQGRSQRVRQTKIR